MQDSYQYYDEGWNARCHDKPFNPQASLSWRDGWLDCHSSALKERYPMECPPQ